MHNKNQTYVNFLQDTHFRKKENSKEEILNFLELIERMTGSLLFPDVAYFVIDYSIKKYILLKGNIPKTTGHLPGDFMSGGLDFIIEIVNKDDFKIYNDNIFKDSLGVLKTTTHGEHAMLTFSHNFRLKSKEGHYVSTLQRGSYITSPDTGMPLFSYGTFQDITAYKNNTTIIHSIDVHMPGNGGAGNRNLLTNYYFPNSEDRELSKREKEILCWIAEGLSIKQAADKLHITESTVTNHRRNIMRKTNTKNIAQLIAYAVRHGII